MKKLSKFIIIAAVAMSGCSKSYFDINQNPNSPSSASVDLVLANALKTTAGFQVAGAGIAGGGIFPTISEWMNFWAPSGSYALNSSDGASYKETTDLADNTWTAMYRNLEDYDYVEKTATANNQYFYIAAAKTMKALVYQQLVDLFNNVPYTEALKGTANLLPKYDKGKDIYEDLSTQLDAAVTLFKRADATAVLAEDDLFGTPAGGTAANENSNWAKFANTLRLRLLIRQTEVPGRAAYIQTEVNKIIANGSGFLTIDAAVNPGYSNSSGKTNPFWGFSYSLAGSYTQDFWRAGKFIVTFAAAHNDPRIKYWYAPLANGNVVGTVVGSTSNPTGGLSSVFGPGVLQSVSQSAVILSASESYFMQAEAGLRGYLANSPSALFKSAVLANFTYLGAKYPPIKSLVAPFPDSITYTVAQSAAIYTSQNDKETNYDACVTFNEKLNCINRQKFLAMNSITPLEAYDDYRRLFYLGLPFTTSVPLSVHPNIDVPGTIPTRFLYPTSEYQTNLANVSGEGTINYHTSKVWWQQ